MLRWGIAALVGWVFVGACYGQKIGESFQAEFFDDSIVPGDFTLVLIDHEGTAIVPFSAVTVPGLTSYVGRPTFDARTGDATANQDVAGISFDYIYGGETTTVDYPIGPVGFSPGPTVTTTTGSNLPTLTGDGFLRVGYEGVTGTSSTAAWDTAHTGGFDSLTGNFTIRLPEGTAANDNADGLGFLYANVADYGNTGAVFTGGEEPSGSGLGIGFDIWDNGNEGGNAVSLHWNGQRIGSVEVTSASPTRDAFLESGEPITVQFVANPGFGHHPPPQVLPMSSYSVSAVHSPVQNGLGPALDVDPGAGVHDAFFRLTDNINDQENALTFDAVPRAGSRPGFAARTGGANEYHDIDNVCVEYGIGTIHATFDFRISDPDNQPADGMSFILANTRYFGQTGAVDVNSDNGRTDISDLWGVAEDPNLAGSFGLGFKTFDADELRVTMDGQRIATIPQEELPASFAGTFVDGEWHNVVVNYDEHRGPLTHMEVLLDDTLVWEGTFFGGGLAINGPEPSSLSLLGLALIGTLGIVRRRR